MQYKNFTLDPFQEEAIKAIESNFSVVVSAPTGSGKTLIADYVIDKHRNDPKKIIYTAPIKALSNQKYKDFTKDYGQENVGLMTGDIVINPEAKILIMTTEIYRNMVVAQDEIIESIAYVIFDEIHYISDPERGTVWEEAIIYSPEKIRFLCLSATIPNASELSRWIQAIKHHQVQTVISEKRNVPLEHLFFDYELGITSLEKIKSAVEVPEYRQIFRQKGKGRPKIPAPNHIDLIRELNPDKLPCLFFHFSRHACQERAWELSQRNLFQKNPKIIEYVAQRLREAPSEISRLESTRIIRQTLPQGIAFHHAGLLPVIKDIVEELFSRGWIKVLYTTETFAVGINMPAKTVCFESLRKFDGQNFRMLNSKEYFQIAGRAGRRGIDTVGYAITMIYRPTFDYQNLKSLTSKDVVPIQSQFKLSTNTVLNLVKQHDEQEIEHILRLSLYSYQKFGDKFDRIPANIILATYNNTVRRLRKMGYLEGMKLTGKGYFSARIFADELALGEIFATDLWPKLDEYQMLLVIASLVYEYRDNDQFINQQKNEQSGKLWNILQKNRYLSENKKFRSLINMTSLIFPVYGGKNFFDLIQNTNLLEGDLIRFFSQLLDRIGQIKKATADHLLARKMDNCKGIIDRALEGIRVV